jgi:hypothetical protein
VAVYKGQQVYYTSDDNLKLVTALVDKDIEQKALLANNNNPNDIILTFTDKTYGEFEFPVGRGFYSALQNHCNLSKEETAEFLQSKAYNLAIAIRDHQPIQEVTKYRYLVKANQELKHVYKKYHVMPFFSVGFDMFDENNLTSLSNKVQLAQAKALENLKDSMNNMPCEDIKIMIAESTYTPPLVDASDAVGLVLDLFLTK